MIGLESVRDFFANVDIWTGSIEPEDCPKFTKCPHGFKTFSDASNVSDPTESYTTSTPF